ncbi:peptidylprolyl isomerase [Candidatus Woesearchaeota archaeon]|nr:peptidylprolyl isomerase [Candidatus Woesearchaeota archaeon]
MQKMNQGDKVKVHYTGTLSDGTVFDSSEGKEPLEFTIGENQVIAGFESGIKEMKLNEEKNINITAKDAYGERDERMVVSVPRDKFPPEVQAGGTLLMKGPNGERFPAVVKDVKEKEIFIDLNHPLAGKDLNFKVKVVAIN